MNYKIELANINELDEIMNLYKQVIKNCYTTWDEFYPSKELIIQDIESFNFYTLKLNNKIVGVSFAGKRNTEDDNKNCGFKLNMKNISTFARICISPNMQNKGLGKLFVSEILNILKNKKFDGIRILVSTQNKNAIALYENFDFIFRNEVLKYDHNYICLEKFL